MTGTRLLLERLRAAGLVDVTGVEDAAGGVAAVAGIATRAEGPPLFAKTFADPPADDVFAVEAEGLRVLTAQGGVRTPRVHLARPDLLVLEALGPRLDTVASWERLAHDVAALHTATRGSRFGWHRDTWLGRRRQDNTWDDDGHRFFAERRLLRWLPEPRVQAALDAEDRRALERLCAALPDLLPPAPACLTHGDLWSQNVLSADGSPALIDPAVSYAWAEVDVSMLWSSPRPPESERFFDVYAELTGLDDGWRARMPLLHLRQNLAVAAQYDPDWGHGEQARAVLAPFRRAPAR